MREIKFRAWDQERKVMIDYDGCISGSGGSGGNGQVINLDIPQDKHYLTIFFERIEGLDCELMQFTGLKDKNGKEIWEGDIVNDEGAVEEITFGKIGYDGKWNGLTGFGFKSNQQEDSFLELQYHDNPDKVEVIGNIYENPELLTSKP